MVVGSCIASVSFMRSSIGMIFSPDFSFLMTISVVYPKPYEGFRGCFIAYSNNNMSVSFVLLTVAELGAYEWTFVDKCVVCSFLRSGDGFDGHQRI
jgi:hypothetical protein